MSCASSGLGASPMCLLKPTKWQQPLFVLLQCPLPYELPNLDKSKVAKIWQLGTGSTTVRRAFEFGRTHVVRPKGKHQATVVWLHGLGDNGASWSQLLETLPLPNIKWICPTAPSQPISLFGGFPSTAFKLAVGGFSMGAATSLYSATCFALGKYNNGNPYPANISAAVGLSGWVPCSKTLNSQLEGKDEAARRAASLPILLCHGKGDDVVPFKFGERSAKALSSSGFRDVTFKVYNGLGHYTTPEEMDGLCTWFNSKLGLEGRS
ncbi:hypothetical protein RHGRI_000666 [Rhododendron griersonianum]|uniref:Phospholipase/carboxylesterase/thioesterase domain-containing protein n=1 Tax=Rhododendron griersonianum TaxID=479676 RepID=A0AAV6LIL8_9ERIC|nr:hypothetical protein RHGRI_000666 [Rhododendron griersonianum]